MPEHDRDKVLISDIKKLTKWFSFLHERNLITEEEAEETTEETTES